MVKEHYGIVIDSGSSGSRVQIYRWPDSNQLQKQSKDESILKSVPQIYQEEKWSFKTSPGVSSFGDKPDKVWDDHYEELIHYAEKIIPKSSWDETPIFILATAGMRLLPKRKRDNLLYQICHNVKRHSDFQMLNCKDQVQIIDGETEGLYGWIGLNYLLGQLDNYDPNDKSSYGFMDMGGASTQISFVPSKQSEITKHKDDLHKVYLRNVNGELQDWDIFVSTWLGFGANEARKRYLKNLINILPEKNNNNEEDDFQTLRIKDPCLPKNTKLDFYHLGHGYDIIGSGNYEECLKTTYPLLLKNLPCNDEPCLFNGVHAPEIDFYKDKFVGISEYWYTANDVFHMGGEYNFLKFSDKVKEFCESDWNDISQNSANGDYNNVSEELLKDACFKANWVLNVLHEGFNLPRIGIEKDVSELKNDLDDNHIPFQSAGTIKGSELSWTLGRILLYASSLIIPSQNDTTQQIGILTSENEGQDFISGGISKALKHEHKDYDSLNYYPFFFIILSFLLLSIYIIIFKPSIWKQFSLHVHQLIKKVKNKYNQYRYTKLSNQVASDLENGIGGSRYNEASSGSLAMSPSLNGSDFNTNLRTRSSANLQGSIRQFDQPLKKSLNSAHSLLDFSSFRRDDLKRSASASVLASE